MRKARAGFTLVEVLVALAVLAIALLAILRALGQSIDLSAALRDRTVALWVAQDTAAMHRIDGRVPSPGTESRTREMAGHRWLVTEKTTEASGGLRRIEIDVAPDGSAVSLAHLVAFLGT